MNEIIYFVEDDENICELINATLKASGYNPVGFIDPLVMLESIKNEKPDMILLDIMLPNMNGFEVLQLLKDSSEYKNIPIIIISAKSSELDKVKGLNLGCDDYLTKPFGILELIARIKANLRKKERSYDDDEKIHIGELCVDLNGYNASVNGECLNLTVKEFEILKHMISNANKVITRENLLMQIWNYDYVVETRSLDMHIKAIRDKIAKYSNKEYITTIRGVGYKFNS